jgi:hypothetical protein
MKFLQRLVAGLMAVAALMSGSGAHGAELNDAALRAKPEGG